MAQRLSTPSGAQLLALAANRAHARRIAETLAAKVRPPSQESTSHSTGGNWWSREDDGVAVSLLHHEGSNLTMVWQ